MYYIYILIMKKRFYVNMNHSSLNYNTPQNYYIHFNIKNIIKHFVKIKIYIYPFY